MSERPQVPDWFFIDGELFHSPRKRGVSLPDWQGDESVGRKTPIYEEVAKSNQRPVVIDAANMTIEQILRNLE